MNSILENTALEKVGKDNAKISVNVNDSAPNEIFKSKVSPDHLQLSVTVKYTSEIHADNNHLHFLVL